MDRFKENLYFLCVCGIVLFCNTFIICNICHSTSSPPNPQFFGHCFFRGAWKDCFLFLLMLLFDFDQVNRIYCYYSLPRKNRLSIWTTPYLLSGINRLSSLSLLLKIIYSAEDLATYTCQSPSLLNSLRGFLGQV